MERKLIDMGASAMGRRWLLAGACISALAGTAAYLGLIGPHRHPAKTGPAAHVATRVGPQEEEGRIQRSAKDAIEVPANMATKMGLRTAPASVVTAPISLPSFQGVLALDNERLSRVHSRFDGEVVELGRSTDGSDPTLRVGEHVRKGDLLAVIWSTDLGKKKSELVDALAKLRAEEQLRDRLKKLFDQGAGAGRSYRDAEKEVQARRVEIASLERTLRAWRLTDEDLDDIRKEVADVQKEVEGVRDGGKHGGAKGPSVDSGDWARVEVRAPAGGVVLEKNVIVGDIVGTDDDLFKIGDLSHLMVWAHVYEEDLPLLEALPRPIPWVLSLPSRPSDLFPGVLDKIGSVIDPAQHTALVTGRVDNPSGRLKVGQFVTATVKLPPPEDELEIPAAAVVEDGRESVVFIQADSDEARFIRSPVRVVRRLKDTIYVKKAGVRPGHRVVTSGALLLQNAMAGLPAPAEPRPGVSVSLHGGPPGDQGGTR